MIHTMAKDRDYQLSKDAENAVRDHIKQYRNDHEATFSNGRYIRNLIERAIRQQAVRLMKFHQYERQALMTLVAEDFKFNESHDKL